MVFINLSSFKKKNPMIRSHTLFNKICRSLKNPAVIDFYFLRLKILEPPRIKSNFYPKLRELIKKTKATSRKNINWVNKNSTGIQLNETQMGVLRKIWRGGDWRLRFAVCQTRSGTQPWLQQCLWKNDVSSSYWLIKHSFHFTDLTISPCQKLHVPFYLILHFEDHHCLIDR